MVSMLAMLSCVLIVFAMLPVLPVLATLMLLYVRAAVLALVCYLKIPTDCSESLHILLSLARHLTVTVDGF